MYKVQDLNNYKPKFHSLRIKSYLTLILVKKISNQDNFHWTSVSAIINLQRLTVHQLIKIIWILKKILLFFIIRIEEAQISRCYYKIIEKQKIRYRILKNFKKYLFSINQINILTHIFTIACMKHIHLLSKAKICKK
jgi:hypothetical protein